MSMCLPNGMRDNRSNITHFFRLSNVYPFPSPSSWSWRLSRGGAFKGLLVSFIMILGFRGDSSGDVVIKTETISWGGWWGPSKHFLIKFEMSESLRFRRIFPLWLGLAWSFGLFRPLSGVVSPQQEWPLSFTSRLRWGCRHLILSDCSQLFFSSFCWRLIRELQILVENCISCIGQRVILWIVPLWS